MSHFRGLGGPDLRVACQLCNSTVNMANTCVKPILILHYVASYLCPCAFSKQTSIMLR